jgi:hypothetical protein
VEIITADDLNTYLGAGVAASSAQLDLLVDLANDLVTETWRTPTEPAPTWVTAIALEVAARPARNPKGLASLTKSVDDGSRTERMLADRAGVYLTKDEAAALRNDGRPRRRQRFGTIRVGLGY